MGRESWYHKVHDPMEYAGREVTRVKSEGMLTASPVGGKPNGREDTDALRRGEYVPEEEIIHVCLNCKRARCPGCCLNVVKAKREIREQKRKEREGQGNEKQGC